MSGKNPDAAKQSGAAVDGSFSDESCPDSDSGETTKPCEKDRKHWFALRVEDDRGKLVKDVKIRLKLSDGAAKTVDLATEKLSLKGFYKVGGLPAGNCEVSFPDLPDEEWKAK